MKVNLIPGLLTVVTVLVTSFSLLAQTPVQDTSPTKSVVAVEHYLADGEYTYTDLGLSDPAIYAGKSFTLSLTVTNTSSKAGLHELSLFLKDESVASVANARKLLRTERIQLAAGEGRALEIVVSAEDLTKGQNPVPDFFVFFLGQYEFGLDYLKE